MVGKEEIFDKTIKGMRKIEFKDIVILFRSPSAFAESYGKVLENMGIPVYVGTRSGYFSTREVQVVLSLLKIIDNSSQDIPLAAVLLSSIGGFTKKETALIRSSCGEEKAFHESCPLVPGKRGGRETSEKTGGFLCSSGGFPAADSFHADP